MSKITVIGAGSVGATIANDLMIQGVASEIVLVDVNKKKAIGEALDIYQGAPFHSPAIVRPGEYADAAGSDIVIITCGIARKPGMSRLDLAQTNVNILKDVSANVVKHAPKAVYVIVSNPVDVLTYVFTKISGLPEHQIIGSGTILDTSLCSLIWQSASTSVPRMSMLMSMASTATAPLCLGLWFILPITILTPIRTALPIRILSTGIRTMTKWRTL